MTKTTMLTVTLWMTAASMTTMRTAFVIYVGLPPERSIPPEK